MALTIYWDSDFKTRSLTPAFIDKAGTPSPFTLSVAGPHEFEMEDTTVGFKFWYKEAGGNVTLDVEVSYDGVTYVSEKISVVVNHTTPFELPTQGIKKVRLTAMGVYVVSDLYFTLLNG